MLTELRIREFAIVEGVTLPIAPGFNVLTGETGAGKSIIVGALGILLGDRASAADVRSGSDRTLIEGTFEATGSAAVLTALAELGIDAADGVVILRREVQASGRGRAWINGSPVPVSTLASIGQHLAVIHGQHEAQSLLDSASQRMMLDAFAGARDNANTVFGLHARVRSLSAEIEAMGARSREAAKRADYLSHVVREIEEAHLVEGEDERLDDEVRRLEHSGELVSNANAASELLGSEAGAVLHNLHRVRRILDSLVRIDPSLERMRESLESASVAVNELARELDDYAESVEVDPERLAEAIVRRDMVIRMARKHGGSVAHALTALAEAREELTLAESGAASIAELERERQKAVAELAEAARELSTKRETAARRLARQVDQLLPSLGMPGGKLRVILPARPEVGATGAEDVEFHVSLNAGHEQRLLAKVASGGELSRIMLALMSIMADIDQTPTLIFDEVDAGIGGEVALRVGDALRSLAEHHQVLVITHLPQIAARAHTQFSVRKSVRGGVTSADIREVSGDDRVEEIARMLSGEPASQIAREHAVTLLRQQKRAAARK